MKATSSELLMRNFNEIFIELDPLKRAALLAESYSEDCLWIHPGGRIMGREGINEAASEIRKHYPEYRYTVTGEIQIMHNVATCRWGSGMPGQPFHYTGTDFLEERDGRVSRLYTFIDQKLSVLNEAFGEDLCHGGIRLLDIVRSNNDRHVE